MLIDALLAANNYVTVKGKDGKCYKLAEACEDIVAHEKLTDAVFDKILDSDCEDAKNLLRRIQRRQFYKSVAEIRLPKDHPLSKLPREAIENDIRKYIDNSAKTKAMETPETVNSSNTIVISGSKQEPLKRDEIIVIMRSVTMGMGDRNPIEKVTFYSKEVNKEKLSQIDSRNMNYSLPDYVLDRTLWIYCRRNGERPLKEAAAIVRTWSKQTNIKIDLE